MDHFFNNNKVLFKHNKTTIKTKINKTKIFNNKIIKIFSLKEII